MRIISVTGGKGGIGKTTISINLAIAFAKMKKKVMLLDADLGLANVDVMLNLKAKKTLHDVLLGHCSLSDIFLKGPHEINIIPASSGVQKMAELAQKEYTGLINAFSSLQDEIDIMIVDMASGVSSQVIDFTNASQDIIVVICNDPASLMDSYAVIKILHQKYNRNQFGIVINKTKHQHEGFEVFSRFQEVTNSFINITLNYLGDIPNDDYIGISAKERVSIVDKYPHSHAVSAINNIGQRILRWEDNTYRGGIQFFLERLVQNQ